MNSFRRTEEESFPFPGFGNMRQRPGFGFGSGRFRNQSFGRRWEQHLGSQPWGELPNPGALEYEEEASDAGPWTNSAEQQAFRDQVLQAHLARSKNRKGAPQPDLSSAQLAAVRGTSVSMRRDAADVASRLLEAANADLRKAQASGDPDAQQTIRITASSGYRGSDHQRRLWLQHFENNYYAKTRKARAAIPDGPHSAKAVSYMLDDFGLPNRIAAPGYSNHQNGIAIDFQQERRPGHEISNSYEAAAQKKWKGSWFYDWLQENAARFSFTQYIKEAWHWEYHPPAAAAPTSRETGFAQELRYDADKPPRPFLGGLVLTFRSSSLPLTVSVFCPRAALSRPSAEVLVYAHGLLTPCPPVPRNLPEDFITSAPFKLGEIVNASNRGMILVVPFFDWKPRQRHALGKPANLNLLVDEVLAAVAAAQGTRSISLSNLILAGHSRAYDFLEPLAASYADPQMRQGALAKLSEVWALDTTYGCNVAAWMSWLNSNPNLRVSVVFRKTIPRERSGTSDCGWSFYFKMKASGGRLNVIPLDPRISHCNVPGSQLPGLLGASAGFARPSPMSNEIYENESYEEEAPMTNLNFEGEAFAGYQPVHDESSEVEHFSGGFKQVMGHGHGHHGGGHHSSRRWRWLHSNQFGSGDSTQDSQSLGWAQNCLSQITGGHVSQSGRMGHSTRRVIRKFQMQQQLPTTGRLDQDTMAALQQACGDQAGGGGGGDDDSSEMQEWAGEIPPPTLSRFSSEVQHQVAPAQTADGHQSFELWFEWNSTKLRQDTEVDSVVQLLSVIKGISDHLQAAGSAGKIILRGFASKEGAETRNQALSLQRAQRVKSLLVDAGIPENRIQAIGAGPSNAWPGGLKWNRRVEIDLQP
jgi:outer membrane protein OmpA-like peptidoglycan-associated protein/LAS superfamily LD-carboxypeptidase LdcB